MMEASQTIGAIAAALAQAQAEITTADKDRQNPHFKQSYATLASVQAACQGPLSANGIAVVQPVSVDVAGERAIVTVRTVLAHSSGEWLGMAVAFESRDAGPQSVGSCITYGRRYGLAAMAGVAPDDDDGNEGQGAPRMASTSIAKGGPLRNKFAGYCNDCGTNVPEQAGESFKQGDKWAVRHLGGKCPEVPQATPDTGRTVPNVDAADCTHCNTEVAPGKGWQRGDKVIHAACAKELKAVREHLAGATR